MIRKFMRKGGGPIPRFIAAVALLALAGGALAQDDFELKAASRVFPGIGPGLRSVKRDAAGNYYVLTAPAASVSVFDPTGKLLRKVPSYEGVSGPQAAELHGISFGEDVDVDAKGTVYVADRGANAVKIWWADGSARMFAVNAPVSIAILSGGEIAVATQQGPHLVTVYDSNGKVLREIGTPEEMSTRPELNRFLSIGRLARDAQDHLYYGFQYLPEPTVRVFDRQGYASGDVQVATLDVMPKAQALRREIQKQEKRGDSPVMRRVLTAVGVDQETGEVWIALENVMHRFDRDGNRRGSYRVYTPQGARIEATVLLLEPGKMLIGGDPIGVYEFERPDRNKDGSVKFRD
jgi:hypothetical protein